MRYNLPSSLTYRCIDRFSVVPDDVNPDDNDGKVTFWPILETILSDQRISSASSLVAALESISTTLRDTSGPAGDYGLLTSFLQTSKTCAGFFEKHWPTVVRLALEMPILFPAGYLNVLSPEATPRLALSRRQVACLVMHQFLCTLRCPDWKVDVDGGFQDFAIWYGSEQKHKQAALAYLEALFRYMSLLDENPGILELPAEDWPISFTLFSGRGPRLGSETLKGLIPLADVAVELLERYNTSPTTLGLPNGAAVISANKFVGFGQSATQEEIHVGISPEACPAVLLTPPLRDDQVLVVTGAQAMLNITGERRDISVTNMPTTDRCELAWKRRTMLFMDALELDMVSDDGELPDLLPGNVDREIYKAFAAFSSGKYDEVRIGLWGCGAFGGDPGVKMLAVWYAASLAGVKLKIICDGSQREFGNEIRDFVVRARSSLREASMLKELLESAPKTLKRYKTLLWFAKNV